MTRSRPHFLTLVFCTALSVLSLNMFLPSLARIAEDFQTDYALVNLSIAGYLAVSAVLQIVVGPLSDRFGRRPVLLVALAVFALASLGCLLAGSIWVFLGFRLLQAAIVAATVVPRAVIRDLYPENEAAAQLGHLSMAMALAPMLGPMLGGALEMGFGWRSNFVLFTVLGLSLLALVYRDLGETAISGASSFARQMREYPELFGARRFWGYTFCLGFSIGAFYSFVTGAPLVAAGWFDLSPAQLGLGIGIITGGFMVGSFLTGQLAGRTALIRLVIAGRIVATLGPLVGLSLFLAGQGSVPAFFGSAICVGFGNGLTVANASAGLMSVRPSLAGSASGLSGALTVALGAVLTTLTGVAVTPENGPFAVLGLMALCSGLGLISALYVRQVERRTAV